MITRKCAVSGQEFIIEDEDLDFYAKMGVITEEEKAILLTSPDKGIEGFVGLPTLCPEERWKKRLLWRNERNLYKRKCDATGKDIISVYDKETPFPVYSQKYWWSDAWDSLDYGQEFDFSKSFFEQFKTLIDRVPHLPIINDNGVQSENCAYCYDFAFGKNCYLVTQSWHVESGFYSIHCNKSKDFCDCSATQNNCEIVYECVNCFQIYNSIFLQNCMNCSDCSFGFDLIGCKNCIGCVGLRNKEFYVFNKKYSQKDYEEFQKKLETNKYSKLEYLRKSWQNHLLQFPRKFTEQKKCTDCFGYEIFESKNAHYSFGSFRVEDSKYIYHSDDVKNSFDVSGGGIQWGLEVETSDNSYFSIFTAWCWKSSNISYSDNCHSSSNCFGCVGLKRQKYCILNKQYTKEEYEELVPKIIAHMKRTGEWGEFFPISMSPFGYNKTVAQEYFPLTKEEALKKGYKWKDEESIDTKKSQEFSWGNIPDDIKDVSDDILNTVLYCERSKKPYKIQKAELAFYRKMNLPIPHLHPDERHKDRMKLRNPRKLWKRTCADCDCEIQTTFAPERSEKVLCEECYLKVMQ